MACLKHQEEDVVCTVCDMERFFDEDPNLRHLKEITLGYLELGRNGLDPVSLDDIGSVFRVNSIEVRGSVPEDLDELSELVEMLRAAFAVASEIDLDPYDRIVRSAEAEGLEGPLVQILRGHGGRDHVHLCLVAITWVTQALNKKFLIEKGYIAGRFDVAPADYSVYIECGNTSVMKAIRTLRNGEKLLVIPFQNRPLKGFLFEPGPNWKEDDIFDRTRVEDVFRDAFKSSP